MGHLFGDMHNSSGRFKAIGEVNGKPVVLKTENGKTTLTIDGDTMFFNTRRDALDYLRRLDKLHENTKGL